jgi:hypothetical protein
MRFINVKHYRCDIELVTKCANQPNIHNPLWTGTPVLSLRRGNTFLCCFSENLGQALEGIENSKDIWNGNLILTALVLEVGSLREFQGVPC